jgi:hypothetical protein
MEISGDIYDINQKNMTMKIKSGDVVYEVRNPKICTCHLQKDFEWSNIMTGTLNDNTRIYTVLKRKVLNAFISDKRNFSGQYGYLMACCEGCKFNANEIETDPVIARKSAAIYQIYSKDVDRYVYYGTILSDAYLDYMDKQGVKLAIDLVETEP